MISKLWKWLTNSFPKVEALQNYEGENFVRKYSVHRVESSEAAIRAVQDICGLELGMPFSGLHPEKILYHFTAHSIYDSNNWIVKAMYDNIINIK